MKTSIVLLLALALCGCASFKTKQVDDSVSYEITKTSTNITTRKITSETKASTKIESKSALANFKSSQTDKTQTATVGSLNQEASGTTNAVLILEKLLGVLREIK